MGSLIERRSELLRAVAVSISLAALLMSESWAMLEQVRTPQSLYLAIQPPSPALEWAALLDTGVFAAVLFLLIAFSRHRPGVGYPGLAAAGGYCVWRCALSFSEFYLIPALFRLTSDWPSLREPSRTIGILLPFPLLPAALFGAIHAPRKTWSIIEAFALILFPFAAWRAAQTSFQIAARPQLGANTKALAPEPANRERKPFVLWLIFDEMDYRAAFADGMELPNLRLLKNTSFHAERAFECSTDTLFVIPSYTVGREVAHVDWQTADDLMLKFAGTREYVPWASQETIFSDAVRAARRTAILGYLHPYCQLFGGLTANCEVFSHPECGDLMKWWSTIRAEPLHGAMLLQASRLLAAPFFVKLHGRMFLEASRVLPAPFLVKRFDGARFRWQDMAVLAHEERATDQYITRMRASVLKAMADPGLDFVYAHFPLPHPPNLNVIPGSKIPIREPGYAGNLQAADHLFGEIRQALVASGRWDDAAVVVTSDHSVRSFWKDKPLLTPSLLSAIENRKEPTIPLLVKLPHQSRPLTYSAPFNAVLVHGIVKALLHGEIEQPEAIAEYLSKHRQDHPLPPSSIPAATGVESPQ